LTRRPLPPDNGHPQTGSDKCRQLSEPIECPLAGLRENLAPFYSEIGRPSIDPELMLRMLIVGYCYGVRFERRLCQEVELHLAYRWFCRLDLDDSGPDHSTFSVNRHGRFRDSDILRQVFEAVVRACMDAGLVKARASPSMPASWKRTPAAIMARRPTRLTGLYQNARPAQLPSSWVSRASVEGAVSKLCIGP
jgi:transposase